jgi:hypothetical protein
MAQVESYCHNKYNNEDQKMKFMKLEAITGKYTYFNTFFSASKSHAVIFCCWLFCIQEEFSCEWKGWNSSGMYNEFPHCNQKLFDFVKEFKAIEDSNRRADQ